MEREQFSSDRIRRFGWSIFILGSPLGNTTVGLALLFVASVLERFRPAPDRTPDPGRWLHITSSKDPFFLAGFAFLGAILISAPNSERPDIALLTGLAFALILWLILRGSAYLVGPATPLSLGTFVPWVLAIGSLGMAIAVATDVARGVARVGGWLGPNGVGGLSAFFAVLAMAYALRERGGSRALLGAISCVIHLVGLALSLSRGSWLGFFASIGVWAILFALSPRANRRLFLLMIFAVLGVALVAVATYAPLSERLLEIVSIEENRDRIYVWSAAIRMFLDQPLTGVGGGNFPFVYAEYRPEGETRTAISFAHNLFLHVGAEYGLLGLIPFTIMIGTALKRGWSAALRGDVMLQAVFAGYVGFIVHDMVDNVTHGMNIGGLFWLLTGVFVHLGRGGGHRSGDQSRPER